MQGRLAQEVLERLPWASVRDSGVQRAEPAGDFSRQSRSIAEQKKKKEK